MTDVSVVMPTLGGEGILVALQKLNSGTLIPHEILICVPAQYVGNVPDGLAENTRVVACPVKGQVAQRAFGFEVAKGELVLQLDDDVRLHPSSLERMVELLGTRENAAIGPRLFDHASGEYKSFLYPENGSLGAFERILGRVTNGAKGYEPGVVTLSGINLGVPIDHDERSHVEWLPGGCILHRRRNLILTNFYPFDGKAFAEDLYHSNLLRSDGIELFRSSEAGADVVFGDSGASLNDHINGMKKYHIAMVRFCEDTGRSKTRFVSFLLLNCIRLVALKLLQGKSG
jgi:glycosyltransferase involved in cell wall biosynthesis